MILPIGQSATLASFRCAQAKGMPTMVTARRIAVMRCPSASPPAGEHQPYDVAENSQGSGTCILSAIVLGARHRLLAEREQRVRSDVECRPCPGQADNGDCHDNGCDNPADCHPKAAEDDPQYVE